jgi:hypothetical protein
VAKVIATIGGIALEPGVSKNRRLYTPEHVKSAVSRAQKRLESGDRPMVMLTHHGAGDDSRQISASLTSMRLDEAGRARYTADITDTQAGRDMASLADTADGKPAHLRTVSIRGYWLGTVRKVKGPDGQPVETADDLELDGLDFTRSPGVDGASVDTFAWADRSGRTETTERVPIYESVQEARVTISEETEAPPDLAAPVLPATVSEALQAMLAPPHILENGTCVTCEASPPMSKRGSGLTGAGRQWADPGYQDDKKQRYDLTTKANAKAAWTFINQGDNAKPYSPAQLKRIKSKIKAALGRFGVKVATESSGWADGWTFDAPVLVSEALAEHYGDPGCAGSWSVSASNGPVNICISSYSMDPEDLDKILRAGADAACKALAALDPDMDGDVDVPGVGPRSDPDGDAPGESAPAGTEPITDPAASPAAATTETEDPAMAETTTPAAGSTPAIDPKVLAEAVATALQQTDADRRARKAEKRSAKEAAAAKLATENAALGQGTPAGAVPVTETAEQREARLRKLVDENFAAAAAKEGLSVAETDEQMIARLLEERLVPLRQARAEGGDGPHRKGIAALEAIADGPGTSALLEKASNEELKHLAAAAFGPRAH